MHISNSSILLLWHAKRKGTTPVAASIMVSDLVSIDDDVFSEESDFHGELSTHKADIGRPYVQISYAGLTSHLRQSTDQIGVQQISKFLQPREVLGCS